MLDKVGGTSNKDEMQVEKKMYTYETTLNNNQRVAFHDVNAKYEQLKAVVYNLTFESEEQMVAAVHAAGMSCSGSNIIKALY